MKKIINKIWFFVSWSLKNQFIYIFPKNAKSKRNELCSLWKISSRCRKCWWIVLCLYFFRGFMLNPIGFGCFLGCYKLVLDAQLEGKLVFNRVFFSKIIIKFSFFHKSHPVLRTAFGMCLKRYCFEQFWDVLRKTKNMQKIKMQFAVYELENHGQRAVNSNISITLLMVKDWF